MSTPTGEPNAPAVDAAATADADDLQVIHHPDPVAPAEPEMTEAELRAYVDAKRALRAEAAAQVAESGMKLSTSLAAMARRYERSNPAFARKLQAIADDPEADRLDDEADQAAREAANRAELRDQGRRNRLALYEAARPLAYRDATVARLHQQQNPVGKDGQAKISVFLNDPDAQTLVLCGPSDKGKTHTAWAVLNQLAAPLTDPGAEYLPKIEVWRTADLAEALTFSNDPDGKLAERVQTCDVLFLDDLLNRRGTDWWADALYRLVEHRASNRRRSIVTVNVAAQDGLAKALDEAFGMLGSPIMSRLRENAVAAWIDGVDMRRWHGDQHPADGLFD